jgi:hypothetical protein
MISGKTLVKVIFSGFLASAICFLLAAIGVTIAGIFLPLTGFFTVGAIFVGVIAATMGKLKNDLAD